MTEPLYANWHQRRLWIWGWAEAELPSDATGTRCSIRLAGRQQAIPAVNLSPVEAIDWLIGRGQEDTPSIRFWTRLAEFVVELLAKRRFYPDLEPAEGGGVRARWRPWVAEENLVKWLQSMALAMPATEMEVDNPLDPPHAVESFLMNATDALVRRAAAADPFFADVRERNGRSGTPPEARWVAALLGDDPAVNATPDELPSLVQLVRQWVSKLERRQSGPIRLEFVLEEPEEAIDAEEDQGGDEVTDKASQIIENGQWPLRLRLCLMDESDAIIDAEELWSQQPPEMLGRNILDRRRWLRDEIRAAVEVLPPLERLVEDPEPSVVLLSTAEAHQLSRRWADEMRERGYGVILPRWMGRQSLGLRMMIHPLEDSDALAPASRDDGAAGQSFESGPSRIGLDTLVNFDWQVAVGDLQMSVETFSRLLASHQPLVRYRDRWIELDEQAATRAIEHLEAKSRGSMTLGEAIRSSFAAQAKSGLEVLGLNGTGWLEHLLDQTPTTAMEAMKQPKEFVGNLRPYQLRGLDWLAFLDRLGIGACLADDMGLGKTIQLIALLLREREGGAPRNGQMNPRPTLLFAPTSVVGNWARELARFAPSLKVLAYHGAQRLRGRELARAAAECDVVVTSYALAHRDREDLSAIRWRRLVLDEAQKIKNPTAASSEAIRSLSAPHRVALTGTPIENHLSELWSIMDALNPGLLGSAGEFRRQFALPIEHGQDRDRADRLRRLIQPFILRRTKSDPLVAAELPQKLEMRVFCNLTREQAATYQRITDEMLVQIGSAGGIRRRGLILAALTRLKQVCDHPALVARDRQSDLDGRSGKCERLVEMMEEVLQEGDAALIFTQYRQMGHLLEKVLARRLGMPLLFLHGGTPAAQRDAMVQRFNAPGSDVRIFLLSLRAGGVGLNLTAANHVFHFDRWWNPAIEQQATDRAHRIGQTRTVQVHKFVCVGTVEERIDRMLQEKLALAEKIVGSGDEWLTNLSTEQLRDCLKLSQEAVGDF